MKDPIASGDAGRQYAAAHSAHYVVRDLPGALELYNEVLASHPGTVEADFSRTRIQNIVNAVIPSKELMAAQMALVFARLRARDTVIARTRSDVPPATDPS